MFVRVDAFLNFFHEVVDLVQGGPHLDGGVEQAGGAHELFHDQALGLFNFVVAGCGAYKNHSVYESFKFIEVQGSVVHGGGQAEAPIDQGLFGVRGRHPTCRAPAEG